MRSGTKPWAGNIGVRKIYCISFNTGVSPLPHKTQIPQIARCCSSKQINQVSQNNNPRPLGEGVISWQKTTNIKAVKITAMACRNHRAASMEHKALALQIIGCLDL